MGLNIVMAKPTLVRPNGQPVAKAVTLSQYENATYPMTEGPDGPSLADYAVLSMGVRFSDPTENASCYLYIKDSANAIVVDKHTQIGPDLNSNFSKSTVGICLNGAIASGTLPTEAEDLLFEELYGTNAFGNGVDPTTGGTIGLRIAGKFPANTQIRSNLYGWGSQFGAVASSNSSALESNEGYSDKFLAEGASVLVFEARFTIASL